jgi:hypothetical protein
MNPYLEQPDAWQDCHLNFIARCQAVLNAQLGPHYFVKAEMKVYAHELGEEERRFFGRADVGIAPGAPVTSPEPARRAAAPVRIALPAAEVERYRWLEIRDRRDRKVVTVIELLSPTNKAPGPDRDDYLWKRARVLASRSHFVEIDLRRGGQRPTPPVLPACAYYALVSRAEERPEMELWPIALRERLPVIPIPLISPDPDALLDLQVVLNQVYDDCGFGWYIYSDTPQPPLSAEDATWAQQFVPVAAP